MMLPIEGRSGSWLVWIWSARLRGFGAGVSRNGLFDGQRGNLLGAFNGA